MFTPDIKETPAFCRYGNTVRALSLLHVCLFALVLVGLPLGVIRVVATLLLVDLVLFVVSANASPLALACTSALWLRRGPVVPAIPYKVLIPIVVQEAYKANAYTVHLSWQLPVTFQSYSFLGAICTFKPMVIIVLVATCRSF